MKHYNVIFLFFMLFSLTLWAEELKENIQVEPKKVEIPNVEPIVKTMELKTPSLSTLIEQVKTAKVKDRRVLMNQLKVQLRKMNKESRHKAMMELKKSFSKKGHLGKAQHKHRKHKNLHEQQSSHQPKYRQLSNGQGAGLGRGQGHGRK